MSSESYVLVPELALLLEEDDERHNLIGVTLESLHDSLGNQGPHSLHEDGHENSAIQQEQSAEQLQPTKQELQEELKKQFATTIQLLEERRESHVQSAVHVLCQADARANWFRPFEHVLCPGGIVQTTY